MSPPDESPDASGRDAFPTLRWTEDGQACSARWRSERGSPPPKRVVVADDRSSADDAYGLACQGVALLWRGDFQNARQLLIALGRRDDRRGRKRGQPAVAPADGSLAQVFNLQRQARSQRARTLGMLLIPLDADYGIPLRRAPDLRQACAQAWGPGREPSVTSLRELLGVNGAHEWRTRGIPIAALGGATIHPHYGVFAPTRGEYVELVARAPLPPACAVSSTGIDVGCGTGVLAAVLARRGIARVLAVDRDPRALACARDNVARLGLSDRVDVEAADLFPQSRAALVVCNPPWVPARPGSPLEHGVYDPDSRMLLGFLQGLAAHLEPDGEGWLILSDLAERLGLRTRTTLLAAIEAAGLEIVDRIDARPAHPRASDPADPLHAARSAEVTSLWRLRARRTGQAPP